ncbi:Protein lsb5 [Wallemia ichthyophaga EXF-994]|uniref:Protein lsb5 n=1 Tax=Wallemia ichthyophaga (strain EXF-994 / CBS 113033) TaxID=1299270 RepID=R9AHW0_WALI9|nr:Protein lsb5 [Wallemia ichthyophaga EXF-994]EOR01777.1 Protein lsb5 [Wallemia ichthyophaga EXF-994]
MKSLRKVLNGEKETSSVTRLIEIYCSKEYEESSIDGVFDIVESMQLMKRTGQVEASRAMRKQLKHGTNHQHIRALTIFHGCVSNGVSSGDFPDSELEARFRLIASDPNYDPKVKKKLRAVLRSLCDENSHNSRFKQLYQDCGSGAPPRPTHKSTSSKSRQSSSSIPKFNAQQKQRMEETPTDAEDPFADPPGT